MLDEDRVKILMEERDVERYGLPFERINENEPIVQTFLYELVDKMKAEAGIDLKNSKLMIEVIPGVAESYYILITRMGTGEEKTVIQQSQQVDTEMYLFQTETIAEAFRLLERSEGLPPSIRELYLYHKRYYVALYFTREQINRPHFTSHIMQLEEFGSRCRFHSANIGILREWGEKLKVPTK